MFPLYRIFKSTANCKTEMSETLAQDINLSTIQCLRGTKWHNGIVCNFTHYKLTWHYDAVTWKTHLPFFDKFTRRQKGW